MAARLWLRSLGDLTAYFGSFVQLRSEQRRKGHVSHWLPDNPEPGGLSVFLVVPERLPFEGNVRFGGESATCVGIQSSLSKLALENTFFLLYMSPEYCVTLRSSLSLSSCGVPPRIPFVECLLVP